MDDLTADLDSRRTVPFRERVDSTEPESDDEPVRQLGSLMTPVIVSVGEVENYDLGTRNNYNKLTQRGWRT